MTDSSRLIGADRTPNSLFLRGGIGNILFQLSAARMISNEFGGGFDVHTRHSQAFIDERTEAAVSYICGNFGFSTERTEARRHALELSGHFLRGKRLLLESSNLNKLLRRRENSRGFAISGYFQNYAFFRDQIEEVAGLMGSFLQDGDRNWESQSNKYVAVHIRLGDYSKLESIYGGLSPDYYRRAIQSIQEVEGTRNLPITVVSNDRKGALNFARSFLSDSEFELSQRSASPLGDLTTLSRASYIVAPSSTFSWWASRIGNSKMIFLPTPFLVSPKKNRRVDLQSPNTMFLERRLPNTSRP
ncbi:MAG: alpha-1,2-fucosyltransferase [Aquiluna sp.]